MFVGSSEETFEAFVSPVQVNPFGDTQAENDVVLLPLSQQQIVVVQDVICLSKTREEVRSWHHTDYRK